MIQLILYSKPGCHLCEGLEEKLAAITGLELTVEVRDITSQPDWFGAYQYEIPILKQVINAQELSLPRPSPRLSVPQLETFLAKHLV